MRVDFIVYLRGGGSPRASLAGPLPPLVSAPAPATAPPPSEARGAYLGLLVVVLVWGLNFPAIKVPLEVMHPFVVNLLRFAVSTLTLGVLWARDARRRGESFTGVVRARPAVVLGLGLVGHVAYQVLFILGISRTAAGSAALLLASSPVWTAILARASGVDRLRTVQAGGLALSAAGVAAVVLGGTRAVDFTGATLVGNLLILASALAWALFTVVSRPVLSSGLAPLGVTFYGVLAALPALAVLGLPHLAATPWARVSGWAWAALVFSGALSTGLAYALWNEAVRAVGPSRTAAFNNLVPFVALAAGYVLLGEPVTLPQVLGGALIVGGLALVRRG
jgi:drug/metabolite transporter (DMT)-like permease